MYHDEIFETSLREVKEESYRALKQEISSMECMIERFLKNVFNTTGARADRDYNTMSMF